MLTVIWTGSYPCLCSGEWRITINGIDWSNAIPVDKRYAPMDTAGTYQEWHFEDWEEVFEDYEDGLEFDEWIAENEWALALPCAPQDLFYEIQAQDWRHNSCGGCI